MAMSNDGQPTDRALCPRLPERGRAKRPTIPKNPRLLLDGHLGDAHTAAL